jgi:hypothetical protein
MFKNSFLKCLAGNNLSHSLKINKPFDSFNASNFYKFQIKNNFDQFKERPKRHFVLLYKFVEDMNYKRSKK